MAEKQTVKKKGCEIFALNPGEKVRPVYQWNENRTDLKKVGEVDIQEELNERAKGTTVYELLDRFRGPDNVYDAYPDKGEGILDPSVFPETSGDITKMNESLDRLQTAKGEEPKKEEQPGKDIDAQIEDLKNQIAALEAEKPQDKPQEANK